MTRLTAIAAISLLGLACTKSGPPPAAAANPIPLDGTHAVLEDMDVKYMHYAIGNTIAAPPETVWAVLTDAPNFTKWNSTLVSLEGDIAPGNEIELTAKIDPKRTFKLEVVEFEPNAKMVWQDGNNVFMGTRTFTLAAAEGGGTDWTMKEAFTGSLLKMISKKLPDFGPDFEAFAADLKREAESRAPDPEPEPEGMDRPEPDAGMDRPE